jgi:hypothetical protein
MAPPIRTVGLDSDSSPIDIPRRFEMLIFLARRLRATLFLFSGVVKVPAIVLLLSFSTLSIAFTLPRSVFSKRFFSLSFFKLHVQTHLSNDIPVRSRFW